MVHVSAVGAKDVVGVDGDLFAQLLFPNEPGKTARPGRDAKADFQPPLIQPSRMPLASSVWTITLQPMYALRVVHMQCVVPSMQMRRVSVCVCEGEMCVSEI